MKIIEDSELGELKKTGEELKAAKSEAESVDTNLADSSSMNSVDESSEGATPTLSTDPSEKNTSR